MTVDEPWLLPSSWRWRNFGDVARVASDLVDPLEFHDWPHIAPNHIESGTGRLLPFNTVAIDGVASPKHRFRAGQILYSKIRPYLAKAVIARFDGLCSADMYPIETDLDPQFLQLWMLTREFTRQAARQQARTVLPKINVRSLSSLPVPVAPFEEQRRIVEVLEDHLSQLDAAGADVLRATQRLESLQDHIASGELVGRFSNAAGFGQPLADAGVDDGLLPLLPADWEWHRLFEVADVVGGVTKDAKKQSDLSLEEVPYLRVANVQRGRLDLTKVTSIRVPTATATRLRLQRGDVLLNEGGDRDKLGRGWVWEGQIDHCIHQNHVFRARIRDGMIDPYLLSWAANMIGGPWCERNGRQTVNLANISLSKIRLMPVPVPPVDTQPQIVARIKSTLDGIQHMEHAVATARRRSLALRRALLTAAFSGHLTTASSTLAIEELAHV